MSISAIVYQTQKKPDGTEDLFLKPYDENPAGQSRINIINPPNTGLRGLIGCHIWGGSSSLMLGTTEIAKRIGYTRAKLVNPETIK